MALPAYSGLEPSHLTLVARRKAARECNRPEQDLRQLLAHVKMLDILERNETESSDSSDDEPEHFLPSEKRQLEFERLRPSLPRERSKTTKHGELEASFQGEHNGQPSVAMSAAMVSVEEVEIEDWDA